MATLVELTAPGAGVYGAQEVDATAEDTATVAMLPSGAVRVQVGCTDQGQGTLTGVGQLVAERLGLAPEDVAVAAGDSDGPVGGGAWASRGLSIGGTAAWRAADAVAGRLLEIAGTLIAGGGRQSDAGRRRGLRPYRCCAADRRRNREDRPLPPASAAAGNLDGSERNAQLRAEDRALLCSQRHPGLPSRHRPGNRRDRPAAPLGGRGLRPGRQPGAGRRPDYRRRGPGPGRSTDGALRLRRRRQPADRFADGLCPAAGRLGAAGP